MYRDACAMELEGIVSKRAEFVPLIRPLHLLASSIRSRN
jgi:hypothetical protein